MCNTLSPTILSSSWINDAIASMDSTQCQLNMPIPYLALTPRCSQEFERVIVKGFSRMRSGHWIESQAQVLPRQWCARHIGKCEDFILQPCGTTPCPFSFLYSTKRLKIVIDSQDQDKVCFFFFFLGLSCQVFVFAFV